MLRQCLFILAWSLGFVWGIARGDEPGVAPDGWTTQVARAETAPRFWVQQPTGKAESSNYELGLAGRGSDALDGRWIRRQPVVPGKHYAFHAEYRSKNVATPAESILARVIWLDAKGTQIDQAEYPLASLPPNGDGWTVVSGTYQVPAAATQAQLELHLRWAGDGMVMWRKAGLVETKPIARRKVRLAAVNHRPRSTKSPQENLEQFAALIGEAARQKADIVCLPESITVVGTGQQYSDVAEPIPGPSTRFLGQHAKKHHLYIVAGLIEHAGKAIYNTSVLIGRDGELVGKYRKVCLPHQEIDSGITPGADYPVFDTDFGRIGMMICWDVSFPEVARELAARGAEFILMPIWGGDEILARARAIENKLYLVASGYDFPTTIYDRFGQPLATAHRDLEVLVREVDMDAREPWPWLGDWRVRVWRDGPATIRSTR
jgi:predicted amidohydrolase